MKQYELLKSDFKMVFSCEPKFEQLLTFFKRCKNWVQDSHKVRTDVSPGLKCTIALQKRFWTCSFTHNKLVLMYNWFSKFIQNANTLMKIKCQCSKKFEWLILAILTRLTLFEKYLCTFLISSFNVIYFPRAIVIPRQHTH